MILSGSKCLTLTSRASLRRSTHSLSPLAAAFNSRRSPKISMMGNKKSSGLFNIPELTHANGFGYLKDSCIKRSNELVREACDPQRSRLLASVFDDLSDELCKVADMAEFLRLSHPSSDFSASAEDACIAISGLVEQLNTHVGLYESLYQVVTHGDKNFSETQVDKHVAKLFLFDFQQCGIHLDDVSRQKVVELNDKILQIGQQFSYGTQKPFRVKKMSLPSNIRSHFNIEGDYAVVNGLNVETSNDLAREAAYKLYYRHDDEQEFLLRHMLEYRHELAHLCGFQTFGHRVMVDSLASSPENISSFLSHLSENLQPILKEDYADLFNMKMKSNPLAKSLEVWDVAHYTNLARNSLFDINSEKVSEYFSLGVCMEGLNTLFKCLYDVELEMESVEDGELWHSDVYKLAVKDLKTQSNLGHIYCDLFSRNKKPYQDCHFTIRGGRQLPDGSYQNPVVVLMLNLPAPWFTSPSLLTGSMIDNLFHEMGHAMHSMLARTKYQHVTGTRCSTDFAEVPSTLMEYFCSDPRVLTKISKHYKTGESLPLNVAEKFCASKKVFTSVDVHTQFFYSLIDQVFHSDNPLSSDSTTEVLKQLHSKHLSLSYYDGIAWQHRFAHLVGYGARYYSYLMARSVASSIWQKYFQEDPFNSDAGEKYRRECLSHGGGKPSNRLVSDFLGEKIKPENLSASLIEEIHAKNQKLEFMLKANKP